jgi:hypothetical protein
MEGGDRKRARVERFRGILDLAERLPQRDARSLVWRRLTPEDREVVRHAHNPRRPLSAPQAAALTRYCCARGYTELLRWVDRVARGAGFLRQEGQVCIAAAEGGHTEVLAYLQTRLPRGAAYVDDYGYKYAARAGHVALCRWLSAPDGGSHPVPTHGEIELEAANHGHTAVLEWLVGVRPLNLWPVVCAAAAANGHLETIRWLRAHHCQWDVNTIERAAEHGHVRVVEWARANGAPEEEAW